MSGYNDFVGLGCVDSPGVRFFDMELQLLEKSWNTKCQGVAFRGQFSQCVHPEAEQGLRH